MGNMIMMKILKIKQAVQLLKQEYINFVHSIHTHVHIHVREKGGEEWLPVPHF